MSLKSVERPEANIAVLEIEVDKDTFEAACQRSYKKNAGKIQMQGFRKGKAPRKMIEKFYGPDIFFEDAVQDTYTVAYDEAVSDSGLDVISQPECDIKNIGENGYTFTAKVTLKPEISVGTYKGVEAVMPEIAVTDEEVDAEIEDRRKKSGRIEVKEGPAVMDDTVVIDYDGSVDGVPFEGGKAENYSLKLGSGQFIPGFEEQLVGKTAGDECDVNVTFPEEYHSEDLKGKPAVFKVKIHEVKTEILPAVDDEFAKDVSEFETLEEYKADTKTKLLESKKKMAEDGFEGAVLDRIIETIDGDIPEIMFENQLDRITQDYSYRMQSQGITLENYLKITGMDMDSFRKTFRSQAERQVKVRLALEFIAKTENFEVSEDEINAEYSRMAENYKMETEKIKEVLTAEDMLDDLKIQKAVEFVKENAVKTSPVKAEENTDKTAE